MKIVLNSKSFTLTDSEMFNLKVNVRKREKSFLKKGINPSAPSSDQDRIPPYNINKISSKQVMRINKNIN